MICSVIGGGGIQRSELTSMYSQAYCNVKEDFKYKKKKSCMGLLPLPYLSRDGSIVLYVVYNNVSL